MELGESEKLNYPVKIVLRKDRHQLPPKFSITPVRALEDTLLNPAAFKVLVSLGAYADKRGCCYPAQGTLAKRLHVSRQAVNRQIQILIERGYLKKVPRTHPSGARLSCFYQILFDDPKGEGGSESPKPILQGDNLQEGGSILNNHNSHIELTGATGREKEQFSPGYNQRFMQNLPTLQGIPHETTTASVSETIRVSSPVTLPVTLPETSDVAQTSYLTPQLTPTENGEKSAQIIPARSLPRPPSSRAKMPHSQFTNSGFGNPRDLDENPDQELCSKNTIRSLGTGLEEFHPDLKVYLAVSQRRPQAQDIDSILQSLKSLRKKYPDDLSLKSFLIPFWQRWCNTRTANGAPYNRNNSAWLTDWAFHAATEEQGDNLPGERVSSDPALFLRANDPRPEGCQ